MTDSFNHRIQVFSSDGTYLRSFGTKGDKQREFNLPSGIAFDLINGNILVVDRENHRVQLCSNQGEYLSQLGEQGNLDHQLLFPRGLSVDRDRNFIVADSGNKVIKIFLIMATFCVKLAERALLRNPGIVSSVTIIL